MSEDKQKIVDDGILGRSRRVLKMMVSMIREVLGKKKKPR